jgi:hypothetical protein
MLLRAGLEQVVAIPFIQIRLYEIHGNEELLFNLIANQCIQLVYHASRMRGQVGSLVLLELGM